MYENADESQLLQPILQDPAARPLTAARRTPVFRAGSVADEVYILHSGLIALRRTTDAGAVVTVRVVSKGDIIGLHAVTGEGFQRDDAVALQVSTLSCIPKQVVLRYCEQHPQIWPLLMQHALKANEELCTRVQQLSGSDIRTRLLHSVGELAALDVNRTEGNAVIRISQAELAGMVGATRETVSTALNQLAREGMLKLGHRSIVVCDPAHVGRRGLTAVAGG